MLKDFMDRLQTINRKTFYMVTLVGGAALFVLSGWLWWGRVYMNPQNVFEGMLRQNFATSGVTRRTQGPTQSGTLDQTAQLAMGGRMLVRSMSKLSQGNPGGGQSASVTTETITTLTEEYVRYVKLDVSSQDGKKTDFSKVLNIWAKDKVDTSNGLPSGLMNTLMGTFPMANLNASQRSQLLGLMRSKQTYKLEGNVRRATEQGRNVNVYKVKVDPESYVEMLKQFGMMVGTGDIGLDAAQYKEAPDIELEVSVEPVSRQLVAVKYKDGSDRQEVYSAHGVVPTVGLPEKTITTKELQSRVQQIEQQ